MELRSRLGGLGGVVSGALARGCRQGRSAWTRERGRGRGRETEKRERESDRHRERETAGERERRGRKKQKNVDASNTGFGGERLFLGRPRQPYRLVRDDEGVARRERLQRGVEDPGVQIERSKVRSIRHL